MSRKAQTRKARRTPAKARRPKRDTTEGPKQRIWFSLDRADVARVDRLLPTYSRPWHKAKRSDVLRALIVQALDAAEQGASTPRDGPS